MSLHRKFYKTGIKPKADFFEQWLSEFAYKFELDGESECLKQKVSFVLSREEKSYFLNENIVLLKFNFNFIKPKQIFLAKILLLKTLKNPFINFQNSYNFSFLDAKSATFHSSSAHQFEKLNDEAWTKLEFIESVAAHPTCKSSKSHSSQVSLKYNWNESWKFCLELVFERNSKKLKTKKCKELLIRVCFIARIPPENHFFN